MQKLSGVLTIKSIQGRNGPFNVGTLNTDLGDFSVKDAILEQYEEGKYEGDFGVSRIYPSSYFSGGRMVVEVRAKLETISLQSIDHDIGSPAVPEEPDPMDEVPVTAALTTTVNTTLSTDAVVPPAAESTLTVSDDAQTDLDVALFAELWPLSDALKLDPTVDRAKFRSQRDRLKELGFKFLPIGQVWQKL
jgi:hypothetical protein